MVESVGSHFEEYFGKQAEAVIQSPGRINIIGEHTDYNDGYVLPAAIDRYIYVAASKNDDNKARLNAVDLGEDHVTEFNSIERTDRSWVNLINGILSQLSI